MKYLCKGCNKRTKHKSHYGPKYKDHRGDIVSKVTDTCEECGHKTYTEANYSITAEFFSVPLVPKSK